jgi:hypothetical protein
MVLKMQNDIEKAIEAIKNNYPPENYTMLREGLTLAIQALQEKKEREKNEPLTLEELKEMDGEPVFIVFDKKHGYAIVCFRGVGDKYFYFSQTGTAEGMTAIPIFLSGYGKSWLAYRHKPPEVNL